MNKSRYIFLLFITLLVFSMSIKAQSVEWVVKPAEMTIISKSDGLIIFKDKESLFGAYDYTGHEIYPSHADSISNVVNGAALVIMKDFDALRLSGVITDGTYYSTDTDLYLGDYGYFSEDRLPVYNSNGLYGYINKHAKLIVPCQYEEAQPFTCDVAAVATSLAKSFGEGIASRFNRTISKITQNNTNPAVSVKHPQPVDNGSFSDKARYTYIDKDGNETMISQTFKNVSYASPFVNGFAVICSKGLFLRIDSSFHLDKKVTSDEAEKYFISPDYLPIKDSKSVYDTTLMPFSEGEKFGYKFQDEVVVIPQFDYAGYFGDGIAKIEIDNKIGFIRRCDGKFSAHLELSSDLPSDDKSYKVNFILESKGVPANQKIKIVCFDEQKIYASNAESAPYGDDSRLYVLDIPKKAVHYRAENDGIIIWDDSLSDSNLTLLSQKMLENVDITLSNRSVNANVKDQAHFSVIFKNNEPIDLHNVDVSVSGKGVSSINETVSLPSGESVKMPTCINAKSMASSEKRSVSVKLASPDGKYEIKKMLYITVNPF